MHSARWWLEEVFWSLRWFASWVRDLFASLWDDGEG